MVSSCTQSLTFNGQQFAESVNSGKGRSGRVKNAVMDAGHSSIINTTGDR